MTTHFGGVASSTLPRDRAVLAGLDDHGSWALVHATGALRANRDFVIEALKKDGNSLLYAADSLKLDKEVVLTAVGQNGHSLRHASEHLRADRDFALEAVKRHSNAMLFVAAHLREDRSFVLEAVNAGCSLEYVSAPLRTWCLKREALLERMRSAIDCGDVAGLSKGLNDAEAHECPEGDLAEPRLALARLVKYSEVGSLWEPLVPAAGSGLAPVALIKGTWLVELRKRGSRLPRRQDLPPEAMWDFEELKKDAQEYESEARQRRPHKVVAISHCWLRQEHPDPHGEQLKIISEVVERRLHDLGPGVDLAIFLDYCSLFQQPRSDNEAAAFAESLKSVSLWYANEKTEKWLLTLPPAACSLPDDLGATPAARDAIAVLQYTERGWTHFERRIGELLACEGRTRSHLLDLGRISKDKPLPEWAVLQWHCSARQEPPRVPDQLCEELATKRLSDQGDLQILQDCYRLTFSEVTASTKLLVFCDMDWGDSEAQGLAAAIRHFRLLQSIELEGNHFGDAGACQLFDAFVECPLLRRVVLRANRLGDAAAEHLCARIHECRRLEHLDLSFNLIGNHGAGFIVSMLEQEAHPALKELQLNSNDLGTFMKEKLRAAAKSSPGLELHL